VAAAGGVAHSVAVRRGLAVAGAAAAAAAARAVAAQAALAHCGCIGEGGGRFAAAEVLEDSDLRLNE